MERLSNKKAPLRGLNGNGLRTWGLLIVLVGIIGRCIFQCHLLGVGAVSSMELFNAMNGSEEMMLYATIALACQALETCALPIYAFLLAEGFEHTSNCNRYLARLAGAALLSELPYNLAMTGKWLDTSSRNPLFGLVLSLVVLYLCRMFEEKSVKNVLVKLLLLVAGIIWVRMLSIDSGIPLVVLAFVFWAFRKKGVYRNIAGATAAIVCSLTSPLFLAAPMGVLILHFYNGEQGADNRKVNYLSYPVLLLLIGLFGLYGI